MSMGSGRAAIDNHAQKQALKYTKQRPRGRQKAVDLLFPLTGSHDHIYTLCARCKL